MLCQFLKQKNRIIYLLCGAITLASFLCGCGANKVEIQVNDTPEIVEEKGESGEYVGVEDLDFEALKVENKDIYAWLKVPYTNIDGPILQRFLDDTFYTSHNRYGEESAEGAVYSEIFTVQDMCDFNSVLRGNGGEEGIFAELINFENPDFFDKHDTFYIYMPGNVLTYEVVACYHTMGNTPVMEYKFSSEEGCREYINDVFHGKDINKNIREGWEEQLDEDCFLVSLYVNDTVNGSHLVVLGALVNDAAGKINRSELDNEDISALLETIG